MSDNHLGKSMKTVIEKIAVIAFAVAVNAVLPAAIIFGWIRWARRKAQETWLSRLSLLALSLATVSGIVALISVIYAHVIGGFPYYDPRLLRFYKWGRRAKNFVSEKNQELNYESRIPLTPTGLLMEGHFTQISGSFDSVTLKEIGR